MGPINKIEKKGSKSELLPNRHAMSRIVKGEPWERAMNNYAKATPSGAGAADAPSIMDMADSLPMRKFK